MTEFAPADPPSGVPDLVVPSRLSRWTRWRRVGRIALGVLFVLLGVAGLFLPFLQGILFLAIGGTLLAPDIPFVRRGFISAYRRYPKIRRLVPRRYRRLGSNAAIEVEYAPPAASASASSAPVARAPQTPAVTVSGDDGDT